MTRTLYILAGGNDRSYDDYGPKLAKVVSDWVANPKILSCFFSKEETTWERSAVNWSEWFKAQFGQGIEYKVASTAAFMDEVVWADIVYLHGGTTQLLQSALDAYDNLEKAFKGKVIVGSSAGANYLSKTYFSPKRDIVGHGSGIVDIHTIVHYGANDGGEISLDSEGWRSVITRVEQAIKEDGGDGYITLLPEGLFTVVVK